MEVPGVPPGARPTEDTTYSVRQPMMALDVVYATRIFPGLHRARSVVFGTPRGVLFGSERGVDRTGLTVTVRGAPAGDAARRRARPRSPRGGFSAKARASPPG